MNVHIKREGDDGWWQSDPTNGYSYAGPVYRERNGGTIIARGQISEQWVQLWWNPDRICYQIDVLAEAGYPRTCRPH